MSKHLVVELDGVKLELEDYHGELWLHCEVSDWSVKAYKTYLGVWEEVVKQLKEKGVQKVYALSDNEKLDKFAMLFGMEPFAVLEEDKAVFIYEVK